jgi:hypothetical protein
MVTSPVRLHSLQGMSQVQNSSECMPWWIKMPIWCWLSIWMMCRGLILLTDQWLQVKVREVMKDPGRSNRYPRGVQQSWFTILIFSILLLSILAYHQRWWLLPNTSHNTWIVGNLSGLNSSMTQGKGLSKSSFSFALTGNWIMHPLDATESSQNVCSPDYVTPVTGNSTSITNLHNSQTKITFQTDSNRSRNHSSLFSTWAPRFADLSNKQRSPTYCDRNPRSQSTN